MAVREKTITKDFRLDVQSQLCITSNFQYPQRSEIRGNACVQDCMREGQVRCRSRAATFDFDATAVHVHTQYLCTSFIPSPDPTEHANPEESGRVTE